MNLFTAKPDRARAKPKRYILHIGGRFTSTAKQDPAFEYVKYGDKIARRIHRRRTFGQRSRIERSIATAREEKAEYAQLAGNSHERRRFIEAGRADRKGSAT